MVPTLATFYAHQNFHQAAAANPAVRPTMPNMAEATTQFLALPPDRQRHLHATFIARQRIASQNNPQPHQAKAGPPHQVLHPSLSGSTNAAASSSARPGQYTPSPARPRAKDPVKRLRIDVPERKPSSSPLREVNPLTALIHSATTRPFTPGGARPREDGLRGSMRGEIARLMYASGDVIEPDVDAVDYMEDMVVEFLADLCRPVPPIRTNPNVARQAVPLSADILRHRLASHSYLKKYLERWDDMTYMWQELQQSKRVAAPSHADLIQSVGKQFLGLDEEQAQAAGAKRRAPDGDDASKKRGRPPKPPEERKKPGPKKGWKKNLDPNAPPKKRAAGKPLGKKKGPGSAAPSPSKGA